MWQSHKYTIRQSVARNNWWYKGSPVCPRSVLPSVLSSYLAPSLLPLPYMLLGRLTVEDYWLTNCRWLPIAESLRQSADSGVAYLGRVWVNCLRHVYSAHRCPYWISSGLCVLITIFVTFTVWVINWIKFMHCCQIRRNFECSEYLCRVCNKYLMSLYFETVSHAFLPLTAAKLSTVKNSLVFWPTLYIVIHTPI